MKFWRRIKSLLLFAGDLIAKVMSAYDTLIRNNRTVDVLTIQTALLKNLLAEFDDLKQSIKFSDPPLTIAQLASKLSQRASFLSESYSNTAFVTTQAQQPVPSNQYAQSYYVSSPPTQAYDFQSASRSYLLSQPHDFPYDPYYQQNGAQAGPTSRHGNQVLLDI